MSLFQPKWMSKNLKTAYASVDKLQNENKLCEAVINSPHETIRLAAARKLKTDEAVLSALRQIKGTGRQYDLLIKELVRRLHDKKRMKEFLTAPELIVKYYALKYSESDDEAFDLLKKASDNGEQLCIEAYADTLTIDQCYSLMRTSRRKIFGTEFTATLFAQMKRCLPDRERFEDMLRELALNTDNEEIAYNAFHELSIPSIIQRYNNAVRTNQLREEEAARRVQEQKEMEERAKFQTNKERFLRGEELSSRDEGAVIRSLTTEEIESYGLTVPLFENLYLCHDFETFRGKVLIPCTNQTILLYLIGCLDQEKSKPEEIGNKASHAARFLAILYRSGRFTDEIQKLTGKVLQPAGKMPNFNMNDPEEREWASGYHPKPEIRFDPEEEYGKRYTFVS